MGLHLASCGAGVSLARSVISDRAVVPSHPGRCTDGLMCGEMSREQSFSPSLSSPLCLSLCLSTSPCFLFTSFCFPSPRSLLSHLCPFIFSTSHYLPLPFMHLFSSITFFTHPPSLFLPSLCFPPPPPPLISPLPPVVTVSWGCRVSSLCSGSRGTRWEAQRNELIETQEPISGLCYRKICPFTLRRAARRADGGPVMGRCCRRNTHPLLLFWWSLSSQ